MKRILFLLLISSAAAAYSAPLTPEAALARVNDFGGRHARSVVAAPRLLTTLTDSQGEAAIYLYTYSGEEGFMLLPADDAVVPVLGYSETNSFAVNNLSPDMKSWLSLYAEQIGEVRTEASYKYTATRAAERPAIAPLLKTTWDQGAPYNNQCPRMNGYKCVTGCVATAMAQVMKYWEYPATGKGSLTYSPTTLDQDLSIDFSSITFDWDNMLNAYGRSYSSTAAQAVSTLMKACGYSVKMKYTNWESGAYSRDIANAMKTYFGYDQGATRKERSNYTQDEWNQMVYDELVNVGPVIYSGQSADGGHCFVCDGYDGNGYFHINWGWGGMSDGYFVLNELTPRDIGTGGHYGGYNMSQEITMGIMPPVGRLSLIGITIDNAAADSGNVKGWGYTYRMNDFSNIQLSVNLRISGGHISSPLYVTAYETDPTTLKNGNIAVQSTFDDRLNASDGTTKCSTRLNMTNFDPGMLYTLNIEYDLKGVRTTIGNVRLAASSGVEDVLAENAALTLYREGNELRAAGSGNVTLELFDINGNRIGLAAGESPSLQLSSLPNGVYIGKATAQTGESRTLKLLLK